MHELKRYFSYMGKHQFTYWMILITTIVTENVLNILYSYVNKQTLNAIEYSDMRLFRSAVILCVIVLILRCLFPYLRYFSIHLVRQMFFEVKSTLFDKLLTLNMSWYESNHSGDGIKALNWDANSLKDSWVFPRILDTGKSNYRYFITYNYVYLLSTTCRNIRCCMFNDCYCDDIP